MQQHITIVIVIMIQLNSKYKRQESIQTSRFFFVLQQNKEET